MLLKKKAVEGSSVSSEMLLGAQTPSVVLVCVVTVRPPSSKLLYRPKWLLNHQPSGKHQERKVKSVSMCLLTKEHP